MSLSNKLLIVIRRDCNKTSFASVITTTAGKIDLDLHTKQALAPTRTKEYSQSVTLNFQSHVKVCEYDAKKISHWTTQKTKYYNHNYKYTTKIQ